MSRTITEGFTIIVDKKTGLAATSKSGQMGALTASGKTVWFPKAVQPNKFITYTIHEKGDTFVAAKDSSRTKLQAWLQQNPGKTEADCTIPVDQQSEPLYLKGETVTRGQETVEFIGFNETPITKEVSLEEKFALAAKYGVKLSM